MLTRQGLPVSDSAHPTSIDAITHRHGLLLGISSYAIWGTLPLYFLRLDFASPIEIVAQRILWSLLLCALLLLFTRRLKEVLQVLRQPRQLGLLALSATLILVNWLVYVYAANNGEILQASLGYFTNPLISIFLGVLVLRERLRPLQWLAVALGLGAVIIIGVGYGHPPWLALALAFSFGTYGLLKSFSGRHTSAVTSLTVETLLLAPIALIVLGWLASRGQSHFTSQGLDSALWLASTGLVTAVPLTLFAAAAQRIPLSLLGMLQYLAPTMQFIIAVAIEHEAMSTSRWIGFAIIWLALALLSSSAWLSYRRRRHETRSAVDVQAACTEAAEVH